MVPPEMLALAERLKAALDNFDLQAERRMTARIMEMRAELRAGFVGPRGWRRTYTHFDGPLLARGVLRRVPPSRGADLIPHHDHDEWYRVGRSAVAFVTQPYNVGTEAEEEMKAWATKRGLRCSMPDFPSWHYPGWTKLCVVERLA